MDLSAEKLSGIYKSLRGDRSNFDNYYQILNDFFYVEASDVTKSKGKGQELTADFMLDSTAAHSADVLAAGLANFLTPQSSKWLYLEHPRQDYRDNKQVTEWMQEVSNIVLTTLSRSNFYSETPIFYKDSGIYGTAALFCEKDEEDGVRFFSVPIKRLYFTEDAKGRPCQYFIDFEYTAEQALSRFGEDCSQAIKDQYASGKDTKKHKFFLYIGKRFEREAKKKDKMNKPFRMVWVEDSVKKIVKEDGFDSMPIVAHRFYKRANEQYGFSPAMKALPYARVLHTIVETTLRAAQNQVAPAQALPVDFFLGSPNYDPFGLNYYEYNQNMDIRAAIAPLTGQGNIQVGLSEIEDYRRQIKETMFNDVFLAFTGLEGGQRTVPEVMERISEKMVLLGPAVQRYMSDVLQPLIERVIFILFEQNLLPQLPDVMMQDPSFEVKFIGRLVQNQRQSEITNIMSSLGIAGQVAQFNPQVLDNINADKVLKEVFEISGTSASILRSDEEVAQIRDAQAQAQQIQQGLMATQQVANIQKTGSETDKLDKEVETDAV